MSVDDEIKKFIKTYFKDIKPTPISDIHNLEPIAFDDFATAFVMDQLEKQNKRCLEERHSAWLTIAGFINAHLFWFEQLKNR